MAVVIFFPILTFTKFIGGASAASEATLSSCQSRFAIYVGIVRACNQCLGRSLQCSNIILVIWHMTKTAQYYRPQFQARETSAHANNSVLIIQGVHMQWLNSPNSMTLYLTYSANIRTLNEAASCYLPHDQTQCIHISLLPHSTRE